MSDYQWLRVLTIVCAIFLGAVHSVNGLLAEEPVALTITDRTGLIRFSTRIVEPQSLTITLHRGKNESPDVVLNHSDGLSPPLRGEATSDNVRIFPRVGPGSWQVVLYRKGTSEEDTATSIESITLTSQ